MLAKQVLLKRLEKKIHKGLKIAENAILLSLSIQLRQGRILMKNSLKRSKINK